MLQVSPVAWVPSSFYGGLGINKIAIFFQKNIPDPDSVPDSNPNRYPANAGSGFNESVSVTLPSLFFVLVRGLPILASGRSGMGAIENKKALSYFLLLCGSLSSGSLHDGSDFQFQCQSRSGTGSGSYPTRKLDQVNK